MASTFTRYLIQNQGGALQASSAQRPAAIEPTEILVRIKACAINPADCKMIDAGHRMTSWPLVPGMDGAGVVEAVGSNVRRFAVGDQVLALFTPGNEGASFQELAVIQEPRAAKFPTTWTYEQAATLGVCFHTAVTGLGLGLRTALPFVPDGPQKGFEPSSVLVLGGSSALGAAVLQLLRLAVPKSTILTTSSPKHHQHLLENLRADKAFDRSSPTLVADVKSATPGSRGVDAILDVVGAARTERHYFDTFNPDGPRRYAQVWTGEDEIEVPNGVDSVMFRSRDALQIQGGANMMAALQNLLADGQYRLPLPVRQLSSGFDGLKEGLDLMRKGASGEKLVVTL